MEQVKQNMVELLLDVLCLEVPVDATAFVIHRVDWAEESYEKVVFSSRIQDPLKCGGDMVYIGPGSYSILFTTLSCTEEQAASVVERDRGGFFGNVEGYKEYFKEGEWAMDNEPFGTARASLESLLRSKFLDPAKNYLLIKRTA